MLGAFFHSSGFCFSLNRLRSTARHQRNKQSVTKITRVCLSASIHEIINAPPPHQANTQMPIQSNASPDELESPYYHANKTLCFKWNDYILEKGGKVNGLFNAWSFSVNAAITTRRTWRIEVKKATYSNGSIFLSANKNKFECLTFKTTLPGVGCPNFTIRKSGRSWYKGNHPLFTSIRRLLDDAFQNNEVYRVTFKHDELTISFLHRNDWFEMADRILDFDF